MGNIYKKETISLQLHYYAIKIAVQQAEIRICSQQQRQLHLYKKMLCLLAVTLLLVILFTLWFTLLVA
ncbi:hypothetical protein [Chitinophaga nivalis]|uniref:Uncharacterized protein n=1 Tax=Chitinophaga nivalis TaxID=2991709 RepID=A0ABT3IW87_9BACT|nr:hypothetical protein [Chitinophaga nivalis]MCW3462066.1 hypothetical protein [Chitinophaga nivalis]MCW3488242.1 hypothetical protein [Chitinophaga nivalis]